MYGIAISVGIFSCLLLATKIAKSDKQNTQTLWDVVFVGLCTGIIGARIYHILDFIDYYSTNPAQIWNLPGGGLGIYGGILGGLLGVFSYFKIKNTNPTYWLNLIGIVTPLGQAIGRFGNYFNNELYGKATDLPWGVYINNQKHHPLYFYETVLNMMLFVFLYRSYKKHGLVNKPYYLCAYLIGYSTIRFALEPFRIDPWTIANLNVAQMLSILIILITYGYIHRIRSRRL